MRMRRQERKFGTGWMWIVDVILFFIFPFPSSSNPVGGVSRSRDEKSWRRVGWVEAISQVLTQY
jgi:hypothetical protein